MTTEWTQEQEESGETRTVKFGQFKFGERKFGEQVEVWSGEAEQTATVSEE